MLERCGIDSFFEIVIGNDEGLASKPSPDIYLAAFKKMNILPREAVVVEDAPHGVEAAKASGAKVIEVKGFEDVNLSLFKSMKLL
jgi:HAD superfamily hydrolase (TIGR01509 family)